MLDDGIGSSTRRGRKGILGLMRKGRREVLFPWFMLLLGAMAQAAPFDGRRNGTGARRPGRDDRRGALELGRFGAAQGRSRRGRRDRDGDEPGDRGGGDPGSDRLAPRGAGRGHSRAPARCRRELALGHLEAGRVRARLEVSPASELIVRRGGNVVRIPVAAILERPQHTPPQSPLAVSVERLPWDALQVELGQGGETGVVAPSTLVPLSVRYNILWPDAVDVNVRSTAVLRPMNGGEPVWREERRETLPANRIDPPPQVWTVPAPKAEGTYVLELHATWEPAGGRDGSRLGRLIRRRKPLPVPSSATRRVAVAVVAPRDPGPPGGSAAGGENPGPGTEVDALDLSRIRNTRFSASGRSPGPGAGRNGWAIPPDVLVDAGRKDHDHDRLRGWIKRSVSEAADLGPADDSGLAWSVGRPAASRIRTGRIGSRSRSSAETRRPSAWRSSIPAGPASVPGSCWMPAPRARRS